MKLRNCSYLIAAAALAGATAHATPTPIAVTNYSFEANTVVAHNATVSGWNFIDSVGGDVSGVQNQGAGNPPGTDQNNWAFVNLTGTTSAVTGTITSSATVTTIAASTLYQLTVAVGSNTQAPSNATGNYYLSGDFTISLLANGVVVGTNSVLGSALTQARLTDLSTSFTSPASGGVVGQNLTIRLFSSNDGRNVATGNNGEQSLFDNVRLTSDVPEPASLGLLGLGSLGLLARRRSGSSR